MVRIVAFVAENGDCFYSTCLAHPVALRAVCLTRIAARDRTRQLTAGQACNVDTESNDSLNDCSRGVEVVGVTVESITAIELVRIRDSSVGKNRNQFEQSERGRFFSVCRLPGWSRERLQIGNPQTVSRFSIRLFQKRLLDIQSRQAFCHSRKF